MPLPTSKPSIEPLLRQARGQARYLGVALAGTVLASLTEPLIPGLLKPLLDQGFTRGSLQVWQVPLIVVLLFLARGMATFISQFAMAKATSGILLKLRTEVFNKLLHARPHLFHEHSASELTNTVVHEIQNGVSTLMNTVLALLRDALTLLALLAYLLYLNWQLSLLVALIFPLVVWVMKVLSKRLHLLSRASITATDELAYAVEENVLAHRVIRLHGAQRLQQQRFEVLNQRYRRLVMKAAVASSAMTPITQVLAAVALSGVITLALLQSSDAQITVGGFAAFITAMLMLIAPIKHLSEGASPLTRGMASLSRSLDLLNTFPQEDSGSRSVQPVRGALRWDRVCVHYPNAAHPVVQDLSLDIAPGQTVALVGASGAGKSTLVNLLPRFVEFQSGELSLDGLSVRDWDLAQLRQHIAFVSQDIVLLNDSVAANVSMQATPLSPAQRQRVAACLQAAHLEGLVAGLAEGMDTPMGHNAMRLSGGQRQRMAIARALYKDAPVLVLDEATSALDSESERMVQEALARLTRDRTTVVIAHRLSTIMHADSIVVLHQGRIVEQGTHAELCRLSGHYAQLIRLMEAEPSAPASAAPSSKA